MDVALITQQAATTGLIAKAAVDFYRKSPLPSPKWALPTAAFVFGIIGGFVLNYIDSVPLTGPNAALAVLVGCLGAVSAVLTTEIHEWARK